MKEVRKISKNQQWFLKIAKDAPIKIKEKTTDKELDENKIDKEYFSMVPLPALRSSTTSPRKPA